MPTMLKRTAAILKRRGIDLEDLRTAVPAPPGTPEAARQARILAGTEKGRLSPENPDNPPSLLTEAEQKKRKRKPRAKGASSSRRSLLDGDQSGQQGGTASPGGMGGTVGV